MLVVNTTVSKCSSKCIKVKIYKLWHLGKNLMVCFFYQVHFANWRIHLKAVWSGNHNYTYIKTVFWSVEGDVQYIWDYSKTRCKWDKSYFYMSQLLVTSFILVPPMFLSLLMSLMLCPSFSHSLTSVSSGEKSYLCDLCGFAGGTRHALTKHRRQHTGKHGCTRPRHMS